VSSTVPGKSSTVLSPKVTVVAAHDKLCAPTIVTNQKIPETIKSGILIFVAFS
jgi:hypothetical protein